jgi:RNA polymerase sigma-70 factor, ECF subfamily
MEAQVREIWNDLHHELKKFIFSKVKDIDGTEDILQDVFIKIQQNLHKVSDYSKLTSWVYQITRNTVADHYRKNNSKRSLEGFDMAEQEEQEPVYMSLTNCIQKKIENLPEKYRQVILLAYFSNYSQIKSAGQLNISYSTVKTRVQRGREKLKALVLKCKNVQADGQGNIIAFQKNEK